MSHDGGGGGWSHQLMALPAGADGFSRHGGGNAVRGTVRDAVHSKVTDSWHAQ